MSCARGHVRGLVRPPFAALLLLGALLGMAQTGRFPSMLVQLDALLAVGAWMLFSVAVNDLADQAIDEVNLRADASRRLVSGAASRRDMTGIAGLAAAVALGAAFPLGWASLVVVACGLALAAAYSLPPFRLSGRGALTSAVLPLGYMAVPYLVGALAAGGAQLHPVLLAGLYLGFMGRLVLKDFRDETGDRLYGKRTFLVRHGRDRTLWFSAVFWSAGAVVALGGAPRRLGTLIAVLAYMLVVLALLADVARDDDGRRDVANIAAIAVLGRALLSTVLVQMTMGIGGKSIAAQNLAGVALGIVWMGMAWDGRRDTIAASVPATVRCEPRDVAMVTA